jgi:hypothetical protein
MYSSTCFGHPHAHQQERCYHHAPTVKPEVATAVVQLLMMGVRTPETCWAVHTSKRQVINLRSCCIWLVDLFESFSNFYLSLWSRKLTDKCEVWYWKCQRLVKSTVWICQYWTLFWTLWYVCPPITDVLCLPKWKLHLLVSMFPCNTSAYIFK